MSDLGEKLERMQADGRITPHDADEVRNFADFLAAAGPPTKGPNPRIHAAMHQHYPDDLRRARRDAGLPEACCEPTPAPGGVAARKQEAKS